MAAIKKAIAESRSHYNVRQLAENICSNLRAKDYLSEMLAVYHFTCANTRYMRDPRSTELVRAPQYIVQQLMAGQRPQVDCDDLAGFIGALCEMVGAETRLVTAAFKDAWHGSERQYSHVWVEGRDPSTNVWIALDPVASKNIRAMIARAVAIKIWPVA